MENNAFTHEIRFAIVMYGGTSLAIYMNGVTQELFNLVRSTSPAAGDVSGTAAIYQEAAKILAAARGGIPVRFVIDILTGTSAGGINAVFLAKALATNPPEGVKPLERLWIEKGDIDQLINDDVHRKYEGKPPRPHAKTLFDGDWMYDELLAALEKLNSPAAAGRQPLVEQLDLVVTATDLSGISVQTSLADSVAEERNHRHTFEFHFDPGAGVNDFAPQHDPLLAFAARATSSLPVFEVTQVDALRNTKCIHEFNKIPWHKLFASERDPQSEQHHKRVFADGGYLDNKPFGHAINKLNTRSGGASVTRKLFYLEPNPEIGLEDVSPETLPTFVESGVSAFTLARYETIQEDLRRLAERNRVIGLAQTLMYGLTEDLLAVRPKGPAATKGADLTARVSASPLGPAYGAYHRLRVSTTIDMLARLIANYAHVAEGSDYRRAIRDVVSGWRKSRYSRNPPEHVKHQSESAFLETYDLGFHLRRAHFLLARINQLSLFTPETVEALEHHQSGAPGIRALLQDYQSGNEAKKKEVADAWAELAPLFAEACRVVRTELARLSAVLEPPRNESGADPAQPEVDQVDRLRLDLRDRLAALTGDQERLARVQRDLRAILDGRGTTADDHITTFLEAHTREIESIQAAIEELVRSATETALTDLGDLSNNVQKGTKVARELAGILRGYFDDFELYDAVEFPIFETAGIGDERIPVDVHRISTSDATFLFADAKQLGDEKEARREAAAGKLHGIKYSSFGGFFHESWRENDILWGRLDGAEQLLKSLLPGAPYRKVREELIRRAACCILQEEHCVGVTETSGREELLTAIRNKYPRDDKPPPQHLFKVITRLLHVADENARSLLAPHGTRSAALRLVGKLLIRLLFILQAALVRSSTALLLWIALGTGLVFMSLPLFLPGTFWVGFLFLAGVNIVLLAGAAFGVRRWVRRRFGLPATPIATTQTGGD